MRTDTSPLDLPVLAPRRWTDTPALLRRLAQGAGLVLTLLLIAALVQRYDAILVLALLALVGAGVAMLIRPELATLLTLFLLYINFPAVLTKQHGVPHMIAGSFILLLGFPLLHLVVHRRESLRADRAFLLMLLFLVVLFISTSVAVDRAIALQAIKEYVLEGLLLFWLVINVIRSLRTLRRVLWTLMLAGSLLSVLSLYQTATGSYTQEFGGLAYRNFETQLDEEERDGPDKRRTWHRAQGPLNESNRFAQILIVLLPIAVALHRHGGSRARACAAISGAVITAGVILTLSRGAFIGLVVLAGIMVALRWLPAWRVAVCVLLLTMTAPSVPFFSDRVEKLFQTLDLAGTSATSAPKEIDTAALGRVTVMLAGVNVFLDHAAIGVGPAQFPPFYSQRYSNDPDIKFRDMPPGDWRAHSLYIEIAAETGVAGLAVFLAIAGTIVRRLWKQRRRLISVDPELADIATGFSLGIVIYHVTGVFLHLSYQPYYWLLLALATATLHVIQRTRLRDTQYSSQGDPRVLQATVQT